MYCDLCACARAVLFGLGGKQMKISLHGVKLKNNFILLPRIDTAESMQLRILRTRYGFLQVKLSATNSTTGQSQTSNKIITLILSKSIRSLRKLAIAIK